MKNGEKIKITFQRLSKDNKHTLIWLINGTKHRRDFTCDDKQLANEKFKKLEEVIKKHYDK